MTSTLLDRSAPLGGSLAEVLSPFDELAPDDPRWDEIVAELTRRRFIGRGAAGALTLGLAALGADTADAATGTRLISTAKGSVKVPADPRRVVCLDPGFSWQTLLEVGLVPVGLPVVVDSLVQARNLTRIKGVPTVLDAQGNPDLEKIAALRPDLILATSDGQSASVYAKLEQVAPVAAYAFNFPSDWVSLDHSYANAVNRLGQLGTVTGGYNQRVAAIKRRYGSVIAAQKWALVTESTNQVYVWGKRSSAGPVLDAAGARFSKGTPGASSPFTALSLEKLDALSDATVILYGAGAGADGKPYADTAGLLTQPLFKRLPAAQAGRVYPLPSWFAYCYQDALAQLEGLEKVCHDLQRRSA